MNLSSEHKNFLKNFNLLILDADGVLFDRKEYSFILENGNVSILKKRDYVDGQGLSFLRQLGIRILFVSGEDKPLQSVVKKINNLPMVAKPKILPVDCLASTSTKGKKEELIEGWLNKNNLSWNDCVYIGDDMNDYKAMLKSALRVSPKNGTRQIKKIADIVLDDRGGDGAIREFAELVLDIRRIEEKNLLIS